MCVKSYGKHKRRKKNIKARHYEKKRTDSFFKELTVTF
jgi:hypothetical protein